MKLYELFPSVTVKVTSLIEHVSKMTIPEVQKGRYTHNR